MFKIKLIKPIFWDQSGFNFFSFILTPLSIITFLVNFLKKFVKKKKLSSKTICVGNIYLGGTGKTQLVIELNNILKKKYKISVIKKFYENQLDEQKLLKSKTNLILVKNRVNGINNIKNANSVLIFDDGLQDKSIAYDLSIVCFSSINGIGNGKLLPAGPLREQLSELNKYNVVFINGNKNKKLESKIRLINKDIKIFYGKYFLKNKKNFSSKLNYLAVCGIGTPKNFFNLLSQNKINIKKKIIFPDHFQYKLSDVRNLTNIAKKNKLKIVTTEKDFMKLRKFKNFNIKYTNVVLKINNLNKLEKMFKNYL